MSNERMTIPTKIKVGYNSRADTYTGKLAYVIYYDVKGKIRKEASWLSWRDEKLGSDEFDNVPTSGFVLNKKVGDYKSDWNHRMAHIRVYDPRGFEFEIGVENLLYILQECTSTKGKGLEGEFVYAWDRSDLVLLPVSSQEYVSSRTFTDGLSMKVTKADMKEGCVYMTKKQEAVIYLGKHVWYDGDVYKVASYSDSPDGNVLYNYKGGSERHVFAIIEKRKSYGNDYFSDVGFTKLASKISDVISTDYADKFEKFKKSFEGAGIKEMVFNPFHPDIGYLSCYNDYIVKHDGVYYKVNFTHNMFSPGYNTYTRQNDREEYSIHARYVISADGNTVKYTKCDKILSKTTYEAIKKMEFFKVDGVLHNNQHVAVHF